MHFLVMSLKKKFISSKMGIELGLQYYIIKSLYSKKETKMCTINLISISWILFIIDLIETLIDPFSNSINCFKPKSRILSESTKNCIKLDDSNFFCQPIYPNKDWIQKLKARFTSRFKIIKILRLQNYQQKGNSKKDLAFTKELLRV